MTAAALAVVLLGASTAPAQRPPDNPVGATVSLAAAQVAPGATLTFAGAGFLNEARKGQLVNVKLDDAALLSGGGVAADGAGALAGTVTIPADARPGPHWLRFLAGSGRPGDTPARSLTADFTVVAPPAPPPPPAPAPAAPPAVEIRSTHLPRRGARTRLRLACSGAPCRGTIEAKTAQRVRLNGRRRVVTLARAPFSLPAGAARTIELKLSRGGQALGRRVRALVTVRPTGGRTITKALTLR